jgi:hypothetical protein
MRSNSSRGKSSIRRCSRFPSDSGDPEVYASSAVSAQRVAAILASRKDSVLRLAYPIGDLLQAVFFFWKDSVGLALGYEGPRPAGSHSIPGDVYHVQIPDARNSDHGDYIPGETPSPNQLSAAEFAREVLQGTAIPRYP